MADPVVLENLAIWLGGYSIEGSLDECRFTAGRAQLADKRFGDLLDAKFPGILSANIDVKGFYDVTNVDAPLATRVIPTVDKSSWPLTLCPPYAPTAAPGAAGNICYTLLGAQYEYNLGDKHGNSLPYSLKTLPRSQGSDGALVRGTVILPKATVAATTTGTGRQLGLLNTGHVLVGILHVFTVTGGTWTLTIESDDNSGFTTPVTRQTFTGATAITRQAIITAGPIATDTWWRAVLTKSGGTSCNAAVVLAIL